MFWSVFPLVDYEVSSWGGVFSFWGRVWVFSIFLIQTRFVKKPFLLHTIGHFAHQATFKPRLRTSNCEQMYEQMDHSCLQSIIKGHKNVLASDGCVAHICLCIALHDAPLVESTGTHHWRDVFGLVTDVDALHGTCCWSSLPRSVDKKYGGAIVCLQPMWVEVFVCRWPPWGNASMPPHIFFCKVPFYNMTEISTIMFQV